MRTANDWLAPQKATAIRMYEAGEPIRRIAVAVGRTERAVESALGRWDVHRTGNHLAWPRICAALADGRSMTISELCESTGLSKWAMYVAIRQNRALIHIASFDRTMRKPAAVWKLGKRRDAPKPISARALACAARESTSPFAVVAGAVAPLQTVAGRVFKQDMTIRADELEEA